MRTIFAVVLVLYSGAAVAQTSPPTVGGKPLVQVKPSGEAAKSKSKSAVAAAHNSIAVQETAGATPSAYREKHSRKCDNHLIDAYVRIVLRRLPASMLRRVYEMPVLDWEVI